MYYLFESEMDVFWYKSGVENRRLHLNGCAMSEFQYLFQVACKVDLLVSGTYISGISGGK